jgi:ABC-type molybdate transport system substrate-binding protein
LAADKSYTDIAHQKGLVVERLPLAEISPVVLVQKGNPKQISSLKDLQRGDIRLSLGNPENAAIGKCTKTILLEARLWYEVEAQVTRRGVFKPTVPELAMDVQIGATDAAIVWDTTAHQYPELEVVRCAELSQHREEITIAVLKRSQCASLALRFCRFLNSEKCLSLFTDHGYRAMEGDRWSWTPELLFFCGSLNRRAVEPVLARFEAREGVRVQTKYNGCGILTADMEVLKKSSSELNFPDIYMACDRYYLDNVQDWFHHDVDVSKADIVIVVPKGNPKNISGLKDLCGADISLSVGQPSQCTIGALTKIMLEREGIYEQVMNNVRVSTASSAMLVPTVVKTKNMETVLDATIAYRNDTITLRDQVDIIPIVAGLGMATQSFSLSKSTAYPQLGQRLRTAMLAAKDDFTKAGFHFVCDPGSVSELHPVDRD